MSNLPHGLGLPTATLPMKDQTPTTVALIAGLLIASGFTAWLLIKNRDEATATAVREKDAAIASAEIERVRSEAQAIEEKKLRDRASAVEAVKLKEELRERLEQKDTRTREAVLTFNSEEAYRKFLARAEKAGLSLRGKIDALRTVRVGYETLDSLFDDLTGNSTDYRGIDANFLVHLPTVPSPEDRSKVSQVPLGNNSLAFLGATGDRSNWGKGVTIAVLDTGVATDLTLTGGRLQYLDVGLGMSPGTGVEDGHGTAVAGLAAGAAADAPGVAAGANILSIRVTSTDGSSDSFTLAQGILAAVDAGAQIINVSMGSYGATSVLTNAIDYATAKGVAIVASAGNDGAAQLTWPAADPRVISVGAVDALEQQVYFSNSGVQLKITAPGYGVDAAWLGGQRVIFDGTSASAPLVSGALAALVSTNPGMTTIQAWSLLQQYASDGGVPGADSEYGAGILNLGWAMNRNDSTRIDTAIAGEYYDAAAGTMNVVVQNRGGQAVSGMQLKLSVSGANSSSLIPALNPGQTYLVQTPVSAEQITAAGGIVFRTQLNNPNGVVDQQPSNNSKAGVIVPPVK